MTMKPTRTVLWFIVCATVVSVAAFLGNFLPPGTAGQTDFVEYAAASRLLRAGENPYDATRLLPLQRSAGWEGDKAQMMWNPPWAFPLVLPTGLLDWPNAFLAWSALQAILVAVAARLAWKVSGGPDRLAWMAVLLALTFAPTIFLVRLGQISGFLAFGLAGFLVASRANRPLLAGAFAALTALKPHLLLPFAALLGYDVFVSRSGRRVVLAVVIVLTLAALFPLIWNADVWQQYIIAVQAPTDEFHASPSDWQAPTFATEFRDFVGGSLAVQFLPSLLTTLGILAYRFYRGRDWNWPTELPLITLLAVLTSGYGAWGFDLVVLLLPILHAAARLANGDKARLTLWVGVGFFLFNAAMLTGKVPVIWWTLTIAVGYFAILFTTPSAKTDRAPACRA